MKSRNNVFWGVLLVVAGGLIILSQLGWFLPFGHFSLWRILLIVILVAILVRSAARANFVGVFVPAALIYNTLRGMGPMWHWLPHINPFILVAAAAIAGLGVNMLVRPRPTQRPRTMIEDNHSGNGNEGVKQTVYEDGEDDNYPFARVNFGSMSKYLHSDALVAGQFIVSFGSLNVYFDQARLSPAGGEIYVDCNFGTLKLYVPRTWRVVDKIGTVLAGVSATDNNAAADAPTLTLMGNATLGSVNVEYI